MTAEHMTFERANTLMIYDPKTGELAWRATGESINSQTVSVDGSAYRTHRVCWLLVTGAWAKHSISHADGDHSNNRLANLRLTDQQLNRLQFRAEPTGRRGVKYRPDIGMYIAQARDSSQLHHLGYYPTVEEAVAAVAFADRLLGNKVKPKGPATQPKAEKLDLFALFKTAEEMVGTAVRQTGFEPIPNTKEAA